MAEDSAASPLAAIEVVATESQALTGPSIFPGAKVMISNSSVLVGYADVHYRVCRGSRTAGTRETLKNISNQALVLV